MSTNPHIKAASSSGLTALLSKTGTTRSHAATQTQASSFKSALAASGQSTTSSTAKAASASTATQGTTAAKVTASTTDVFSTGPGTSKSVMTTPWTLSDGLALASGGGGDYAAGTTGVNEYGVNYQVQPNGVVVYTDQRSLA